MEKNKGKMKLVITARDYSNTGPEAMKLLEAEDFLIEDHTEDVFGSGSTEEEVIAASRDADLVIAGMEPYSRKVLEACPNLKIISRRGIGYDNIDVEYCKTHGIRLVRALGAVEDSVAEAVMSYILYFARRVDLQSMYMHEGQWKRLFMPGAKTRTLGLVGYGGVGRAIARKAAALDMRILYYHRHPDASELKGAADVYGEADSEFAGSGAPANYGAPDEYGARYADIDTLLSESDYVSLNVPLAPDTVKMADADFISRMKPGSVLINIARGAVADEAAIRDAILSGHLGGAAVDVFDKEPCTDSLLVGCPNVIMTPHTAPYTEENFAVSNYLAAENLTKCLKGTIDPKYVLI